MRTRSTTCSLWGTPYRVLAFRRCESPSLRLSLPSVAKSSRIHTILAGLRDLVSTRRYPLRNLVFRPLDSPGRNPRHGRRFRSAAHPFDLARHCLRPIHRSQCSDRRSRCSRGLPTLEQGRHGSGNPSPFIDVWGCRELLRIAMAVPGSHGRWRGQYSVSGSTRAVSSEEDPRPIEHHRSFRGDLSSRSGRGSRDATPPSCRTGRHKAGPR